jgi:acetylglutamate kinase
VKVLIKLGGTLLQNAERQGAIARQLAAIAPDHELVVVHGGGKQVTRFLEERGVQSRFVNGLRVSDEAVIDAVTNVIAGGLNKRLVSVLSQAGVPAIGLSGVDGRLTSAVQFAPELGFVGKPVKTDAGLLALFESAGYVPVVACIAGDEQGNIYNVNADEMAVSCAIAWQADRLVFLTDVPGVRDERGQVISKLTRPEIRELIELGVADGGMQAKLEAVVTALEQGIDEVTIAPGSEPDICVRLLANEALGTRLRSERARPRSVPA